MNEGTRIVRLPGFVHREEAENTGTSSTRWLPELPPAELCFTRSHVEMSDALRREKRSGLMVFALRPGQGIAGSLWLSASEMVRAGIVGRHSQADLHLPDDELLSLRHLAVLVRQRDDRLLVRVLDLRTPHGFRDERGDRLTGALVDGPCMLAAGQHWLFLAPTGVGPLWDVHAEDAWGSLPARVFRNRTNEGRSFRSARRPPRAEERTSEVTRIGGVVDSSEELLVARGEVEEGCITLTSSGRTFRVPIGGRAVDRGVLLGRYTRCDASELFSDGSISRVHALVIRDGGELFLLDLASSNGTWDGGGRSVRAARLDPGASFRLANQCQLEWERAGSVGWVGVC